MSSVLAVIVLFGSGFIIGGSLGMKYGYQDAIQHIDKIVKKIIND